MRRLPLACATILLAACSVMPRQTTEIPPAPVVASGTVTSSVMRDVSEDGMNTPQTATASVLVMNGENGSGALAGSGMVMWPSSWSSSSSSADSGTMMSSSSLSASGTTLATGSGAAVVAGSGALAGSGTVAPPRPSSSSSSTVAAASSSTPMSSSSAMESSVSSLAQGQPPVAPSSTSGATGGGGVQPRRVANNLVISIETDYEAVPPGGLVQLSIPVRNFSVGPAEGFLVEATVPEGATIIDAVLGEIDGRSVRWRFNQLLDNQMYTLHFAVRVPRATGSQTLLPFSARVSGGNLGGSAIVTTNVTVQQDLPQTGVDLGATILGEARSTAANGQRTALIAAALTAVALAVGLLAGRILTSQRG